MWFQEQTNRHDTEDSERLRRLGELNVIFKELVVHDIPRRKATYHIRDSFSWRQNVKCICGFSQSVWNVHTEKN